MEKQTETLVQVRTGHVACVRPLRTGRLMIGDFGLAVALGYSTSLADLANGGCGTIKGWVWWVSKNVLYATTFSDGAPYDYKTRDGNNEQKRSKTRYCFCILGIQNIHIYISHSASIQKTVYFLCLILGDSLKMRLAVLSPAHPAGTILVGYIYGGLRRYIHPTGFRTCLWIPLCA